jgi:hypothetical protein
MVFCSAVKGDLEYSQYNNMLARDERLPIYICYLSLLQNIKLRLSTRSRVSSRLFRLVH